MVAVVKELVDEVEGNQIGSKNYRFSRIGEPLPISPSDDVDVYDPESPPAQPLAVSERYGVVFIAHSSGFCVAKTRDVIDSIKKEEGRASIQELSVVDIPIGKVSILALSADSSTLVASVDGDADLYFFSVSALLNKEQKPSFTCTVEDSSGIKDIRWTKGSDKKFLVLLKNGKLYHGAGQDSLTNVADNVDSVEWSVKGNFVAVARNKVISILSSEFDEKSSMSLSLKSFEGDTDVNSSIKVDSIRWVRSDCIIIGCFHLATDGTEESYSVQVITSRDGKITNASGSPVVISFSDVFLGFIDGAVAPGSAPNMFLSYLDQCELAFIANRKNVDQHIVLFGWSTEENKEAVMIEILNDAWTPRIDCQGNGDDNIVLGLSIDKVSQNKQAKLNFGEEIEVSPCCVLLCLTVDGKLTVFHFASAIGDSARQEANCTSSDEDEDVPFRVHADYELPEVLLKVDEREKEAEKDKETATVHNSVHGNIPQFTSHGDYTTGKQESKHVPDLQNISKQEKQNTPVVKLTHDGKGQLSTLSSQQSGTSKQQPFNVSRSDSSSAVVKDLNIIESQTTLGLRSTDTFQDKNKAGMSDHTARIDVSKDFEGKGALPTQIGATAVQGASIQSWSSGQVISSGPADGKSSKSPSSVVQMNQSHTNSTILSYAHGQPQNNSNSKDFGGSFNLNSYRNKPLTGVGNTGNTESSPVSRSSQVTSQEKFMFGKSANSAATNASSRASSSIRLQNSGPNLSKQFINVEEMTKELDALLENIEGLGGFTDASMSLQKDSVVALEEGISTLSERCRNWKGVMDKRHAKIQLVLDKTVQVLARKIYMEGIVKQATDSRYWDLWNHQKLSSELELKRRHLLEMNQDLTNQLIELEKHFNSLELNKFSESASSQMNPRTLQSKHGPSRYLNSLHSLQNTMSAQLAAADQLSKCLSKQMAVLSIESPSLKKQNVKKELFETIGIPYDDASFISPDSKKASDTLSKKNRMSLSSSVIAKAQSWRNESSTMKSSEPETARRRRDSLDRNWSSFRPPKTTVKRMLLQENGQSVKNGRSPFLIDNQLFNHELEISAFELSSSSSATISDSSKLKDMRNLPATESSEVSSTLLFKDKQQSGSQPETNFFALPSQSTESSRSVLNPYGVIELTKQSEMHFHKTPAISTRFPAQTLSPSNQTNTISNPSDKLVGFSGYTSGNLKHGPAFTESIPTISTRSPGQTLSLSNKTNVVSNSTDKLVGFSGFTSGNSKDGPIATDSSYSEKTSKTRSSPVSAFSPAPRVSDSEIIRSDSRQSAASSSSMSVSLSSSASRPENSSSPSRAKLSFPALSSVDIPPGSLTTSSNANTQTETIHGSVASASFSQSSENSVDSIITPPSLKFSSKTPSTEVTASSTETDKKFEISQPGLQIGKSGPKVEPPVASKLITEVSTSTQSGSQFGFGVSHGEVKTSQEQPSATPVLSSASLSGSATANPLKIDNSDVVYTQEDEMEEEAPEDSRTELTLGSLGGFGIGTSPNPAATKPNPFGASFATASSPPNPFGGSLATASSPPNPPFTMTVSGGELFKPASFSFQSPQPSQPSQPSNFAAFGSGFSNVTAPQISAERSAHPGSGQQALGSVLGSFGQSRQIGAGLPGTGVASGSGFGGFGGNQSSGGFAGNQSTGGFANAAVGGGFASLASAGGGFSGIASAGSGFAAVASTGTGGFGSAAAPGGGFAPAAQTAGGGFAGAASGGGFGGFGNQGSGGFGGFGTQGSGGFSSFGGGGAGRPPPNLLTQMRK